MPDNIPDSLVVKLGSALLIDDRGDVRSTWLASLIDDVAALRAGGTHIIIVSSGAIALGARRLGLADGGRASLDDAQAAAAAGQIVLSGLYADLLSAKGLAAAQMLVTLGDLADRRRYLNASATLSRLLALGAVPIINENDSVATEEIRFGDNDRLAARIAQAAGAELVVLLSNVAGLYDGDPAQAGARRIGSVEQGADITAVLGPSTGPGSGGMAAKVEAGRIAAASGIALAIADGRGPNPLKQYLDSGTGTLFAPADAPAARKAWLLGHLDMRGSVTIDAGARDALSSGRSLLAAGITRIEGDFVRGDAIEVVGENGAKVARGLASYDADDMRRIAGRRTNEQAVLLGYTPRAAVVHRNDMVLL
ncbi:glutamate 5-kinase [Pacificimonas sp. WHA3]|uniref:Glutamate 5-kinase n=1 Tax=Pacificimonas pallii TaxID=2827236 RepID=A0ABS6SI90_9SPHN|nr:glutamate 5-kinase [Pacificimonas pallii]MBV7257582.1 glutamate 5-kinase [Pacificimonas pallii]